MVRRRSTVRFRKGAPAQRHISNGGYELRGLVQARAAFPELTFVDPLSGGGLSADAAEFVIDDRLGWRCGPAGFTGGNVCSAPN